MIGPLYTSTYRDRLRGYRQALRRFSRALDPDLIVDGGLTQSGGYEATNKSVNLRKLARRDPGYQ